MSAIADGDHAAVVAALSAAPSLATSRMTREDESFVAGCLVQLYAGDSALHAAAFSYDVEIARQLVALVADVRARNRRGAQPLHAAVMGSPGGPNWNPARQRSIVLYLVEVGADPNATAIGGVTPLHRAVRNRCAAAVEALLGVGADPLLTNDRGSSAWDLAHRATGRSSAGTPAGKQEQRIIIDLLDEVTRASRPG